jgi:hypothetical protein
MKNNEETETSKSTIFFIGFIVGMVIAFLVAFIANL